MFDSIKIIHECKIIFEEHNIKYKRKENENL